MSQRCEKTRLETLKKHLKYNLNIQKRVIKLNKLGRTTEIPKN